MKRFFNSLFKFVAYSVAAVVILMAVAVGLFRLFLPRLPEYQDQIKSWASDAIGMQVEFSGMDARWGLRGPELEFYDAELIRIGTQTQAIAAQKVSVGVALLRLIADRDLVVDRVTLSDTAIEVRQLVDGRWWVQGMPVDELSQLQAGGAGDVGNIEFVGEDIEIRFLQPEDERPRFFKIPRVRFSRDDETIVVDGVVRLPDALGRDLNLSAIQLLGKPRSERSWDVTVDIDGINLGEASDLLEDEYESRGFSSGQGEIEVSLVVADAAVQSATADIDFTDLSIAEAASFDLRGRLEFGQFDDGLLVAAQELVIVSDDGERPAAELRFEASKNDAGEIVMVDARASYLNLEDLELFLPWFPDEQRTWFLDYAPDGEIRSLHATVSDIHRVAPKYDVAIELDNVGVATVGRWPGVRGLSATIDASTTGGHIEIDATDLTVISDAHFPEPLPLDAVRGRLTWRTSGDRTRVFTDNIRVRSAVMSSENNGELTIHGDSGAPHVDFVSTFSVPDIALAKRYIPRNLLKPKLYQWFQDALVSGSIPRGSARLYGPLDKFPFDGGEGQLLLQGNVRNAEFRFRPDWPAADLIDIDVIVDNARLYSERGQSASSGNQVVDASVEIADLRNPVLTIDAFATGTLETIRQFVMQSPLDKMFGGQLKRVTVDGEAAFDLDLKIPIRTAKEFEVTTRIQASGGSMQIEGFPAGVSDLTGVVTITRDNIVSESLGGTFLGQPVDIALRAANENEPQFSAIASADSVVTAEALVEELGLPLANIVDGQSDYELHVRFPRGGRETPAPLTFDISTGLVGMAVDLPPPFGKSAELELPTAGDIRLSRGGATIESAGIAGNDVAWQLSVVNSETGWDFDRGVLALGGELIEPAETRGLHIRGSTEVFRLQDWLSLSQGGAARLDTVDRIRSIDLGVGDLFLLGQHLVDHRVRVDRSAQDWLVQIEGEHISGSVFLPYDFGGDRALVLDMERLNLPGDDVSPETESSMPDPRRLPPISLRTQAFALGDRNLGAIETEIARTELGLVADRIIATDETFEIVGNGRWVVDESDPMGQKTYMTATLTSNDVQRTMRRLDYDPGIVSDDMSILLDVNWSGGPRPDFLETLNGQVQARFGTGQIEDVEPGAGRVFGLMSIVALPRRLSLDFSDVFEKGFGFDQINGTFRIENGQAYTCNLSLEGPAADIGIIGRAGLADRDYDQTAVVSANFGNTLPVVTAFVAGPQAAAAVLIFSQIFKKPLKEVGQVFYSIEGGWDDPAIESTDAEGFASAGELAGCLAESG
ncbi:MAG: YhdP family protein [Woeseiaceae bacterium]|nr:YhdP family protein [Woeseiaceae bacterium]